MDGKLNAKAAGLDERLALNQGGYIINHIRQAQLLEQYVLLVGLGGLGASAVSAAKTKLRRECSADFQDHIYYRAFDTAENDLKKLCEAKLDQVGLTDGIETVYLDPTVGGAAGTISMPRDYDTLSRTSVGSWLDPASDFKLEGKGAGKTRQAGRTMISYTGVSTQLANALSSVFGEIAEKTVQLKILLFSGTGGGTGSGSYIDIAYLMRDMCAAKNITYINVSAYLFMADVRDPKDASVMPMQENCYAALKETDYFMSLSRHQFGWQKEAYQFKMEGYPNPINRGENIFDSCTLICGTPGGGAAAAFKDPTKKALQTAASAVFSSLIGSRTDPAGKVQTLLDSILDNRDVDVSAQIQKLAEGVFPRNTNFEYRTVGYGSVKMPVEACLIYVAEKIFDKMWTLWDGNQPSDDDVKKLAQLIGIANPQLPESAASVSEFCKLNAEKLGNYTVAEAVDKVMQKAVEQYGQMVGKKAKELAGEVMTKLDVELKQYLQDPNKGPYYIIRMLFGEMSSGTPMESRLKTMIDGIDNKLVELKGAEDVNDVTPERHTAFENFRQRKNRWLGTNGFDNCKEKYVAYYQNEVKIKYQEARKAFYQSIKDGMAESNNRIWSVYTTVLEELKKLLKDNSTIVTQTDKRTESAKQTFSFSLVDMAQPSSEVTNLINYLDGQIKAQNIQKMTDSFTKELLEQGNAWCSWVDGTDESMDLLAQSIRDFLNKQFAGLIHNNLDSFIAAVYGAGNFAAAANAIWTKLDNDAAPVFSPTQNMSLDTSYLCYSYILVPANAPLLKAALQTKAATASHAEIFDSQFSDEVIWFKMYYGIPLYGMDQLKDCEKVYYSELNLHNRHLSRNYGRFPRLLNREVWIQHGAYRNTKVSDARNAVTPEEREAEEQKAARKLIRDAVRYGILYWGQDPDDPTKTCWLLTAPDYRGDRLTTDRLTEKDIRSVNAAINKEMPSPMEVTGIPKGADPAEQLNGLKNGSFGLSSKAFRIFAGTVCAQDQNGQPTNPIDQKWNPVFKRYAPNTEEELAYDLRGDVFRMDLLQDCIKAAEVIAADYLAKAQQELEAQLEAAKRTAATQALAAQTQEFCLFCIYKLIQFDPKKPFNSYYTSGAGFKKLADLTDCAPKQYYHYAALRSLYDGTHDGELSNMRELLNRVKEEATAEKEREYEERRTALFGYADTILNGRDASKLQLGAIGLENALSKFSLPLQQYYGSSGEELIQTLIPFYQYVTANTMNMMPDSFREDPDPDGNPEPVFSL